MTRSLFELLQATQQGGGGYSPFAPEYLAPPPSGFSIPSPTSNSPRYISQGGGQDSGFAGPNFRPGIPNPLKALGEKLRYRTPEAKVGRALNSAIDTALNAKIARIMKEHPEISGPEAVTQAAKELMASSVGSTQDPKFVDAIRTASLGAMKSVGEFDPEAQDKFSLARSRGVEENQRNMDVTNVFNKDTGQRLSLPEAVAFKLMKNNQGTWLETGQFTPNKEPDIGEKVEVKLRNGNLRQFVYDPESTIAPDLDHNKGGYADVTEDIADQKATEAAVKAASEAHKEDLQNKRYELSLANSFDNLEEVKAYKNVLPVIESIKKTSDTGYGDLDFIYAAAKILDPGSVVRESETTLVVKSGGILASILGQGRFQLSGKGRLLPEQRQALESMLQNRVDQYKNAYNQAREKWSGIAMGGEVDPAKVVGPHLEDAYQKESAADRLKRLTKVKQ